MDAQTAMRMKLVAVRAITLVLAARARACWDVEPEVTLWQHIKSRSFSASLCRKKRYEAVVRSYRTIANASHRQNMPDTKSRSSSISASPGRRLNQPALHTNLGPPTTANRKMQMKLLTIASAALIAVAGSTQAMADSGRTRAEVKAELAEAIRTGDILGSGESGLRLNQLYPHRYPTVAKPSGKTRDEVKAELAEAIHTGDIIASGESSYKRNELRPDLYPAVAKGPRSTREQVKAELAEAVRSGNIITVGETSLTQNQLFPDRYRSDTRTARGGGAISTQ